MLSEEVGFETGFKGREGCDICYCCLIAVQLSSRWYFYTSKSSGVLPAVSQKSPQILSEEVGFGTGFEGREREVRAMTEQGNRGQGERVAGCDQTGKQKAGRERVKDCDRTGKQKAGRES